MFGSRNCYACMEETGRARSINREKFQREALEARLREPDSIAAQVFVGYKQILEERRKHPAFHPNGGQRILDLGESLFALTRTSLDEEEMILCVMNVTAEKQHVRVRLGGIGFPQTKSLVDLLSGRTYPAEDGSVQLELEGYQYLWLSGM